MEMNEKSETTSFVDSKVWFGCKIVLLLAQLVASVMLLVSIFQTGVIGGLVLILIILALVVFMALNAVVLMVRRKTSTPVQIFYCVLSAIVTGVCVFAMRYTWAFNGFLDKVTEKKSELVEYSVIVRDKSDIKEVSELLHKSVGFLKTDPKAGNAEKFLKTQVNYDATLYDDIDTLIDAMYGMVSDAITMETDRMNTLKEDASSKLNESRVIYTFKIEVGDDTVEASEKELNKEPFVVYISGSDSRDGIQAVARSDVNILAVVNPAEAKILLVSIPRDMYVQLHNTTGLKDKLTHAGIYGIKRSVETIEDFLGIDIDHTIKVSFDTVVRVVDQLDGIDINSDTAMTLGAGNGKTCTYIVGTQHVDGDCALRFARERKTYETGDRHRGENQQQVITSIIGRLTGSKDYLLKAPEILNIAADSFETSLSRDSITSFIRMQLQEPKNWQVESISVNGTGDMQPTYSMGASLPLYVMIPDETTVTEARNKINQYLGNEPTEATLEVVEQTEKTE